MQMALDFTQRMTAAAQIRTLEGMQRADQNANDKWKHFWDGCVLAAARRKPEITSDDVLAEIESLPQPPTTHNLAAIGPAMKRAAAKGILSYTERVQRSQRPEKHGNRQNIWTSNVFVR